MDKTKKPAFTKSSTSFKAVANLVVYSKTKHTPVSPKRVAVTPLNDGHSAGSPRARTVQNFTLIWLDSNIDESNRDFKHSLTQLRQIVNTIDTFIDVDTCVDFLTQIKDEKVFMIVSGAIGQSAIPVIHDLSQVDSIYVFCGNKLKHEQWAKEWSKVKGVFNQTDQICDTLKRDTEQCDRASVSITVTSGALDHLEPSFMYTQLLKESIIEIEYDDKATKELTDFCRDLYRENEKQLRIIVEFEQDYYLHAPIWWYTREGFTYQMLNRALRTQEVDIIIKMGFFLHDLHQQIKELHSKMEHQDLFTVYRGQGMSNVDVEKIKNSKGGLLAFNNFLSTSTDQHVSLKFAHEALEKSDSVVLFEMTIDPSISSAPFALLDKFSYYKSEKEILFSMHTVFRIGQIQPIEDRLWRVELALTSDDDDRELKRLTERIREETSGTTRWHQLGKLLIKMGNFDKAEEVCQILLEETAKDDDEGLGHLFYLFGLINMNKGDYEKALLFNHKALKLRQTLLTPNHSDLGESYNSIATVHDLMGEYSKALEFIQKSLEIQEKYLPPNHPDLAASYNIIGGVHDSMGEYSKALAFYQKTLEIRQKYLPSNHPDLAASYYNIGLVHKNMEEYSKALELYQKTLEICLKSLPPNHPDLAQTYYNIGAMYENMGEYSKALEFNQKALEIQQESLPPNHPDLSHTYNNMGSVHDNIGEYSKALEFYQKALEIRQKSLPPNHPDLAQTYNNIGLVHDNMGEYSKALSFYERTVQIGQQSLPENHPHLQLYRRNLAEVQKKL
jgi:tetratricopeptide (TPR) repeat protein